MIRLPDIPGLQGSAINAPGVSAGAAAAPAVALGDMAKSIAGVSEHFHNVALDVQQKENARMVSERTTQLAMGKAELDLELRNESDPKAIIEKTRAFYARSKGLVDSQDLPPAVRDQLIPHFDRLATHGVIDAGAQAARLQDKRTLLQMQNELETALGAGDEPGAQAAIARLRETGLVLPEQADSMEREASAKIRLQGAQVEIGKDAAGWIERNPVDKVPKGMNPLQFQRLHESAKEQVRGQTYEDISTLQDLIVSGGITTPEELKAKAGHLRPMVVAKLQEQIDDMSREGYKKRLADPEYQNEVVGKVSEMLAGYEPMAEGYDEQFVEMDGMVRQLPPGAVRDELTRRMDQVRSGKLGEIKTHAEAAQKSVDEVFKARPELFGKVPEVAPIVTQKAINDGFLKDSSKLAALGYSPEQIAEINDKTGEKGDKEPTNASRENAFKRLWEFRAGKGKETADALSMATANAIVQGQTKVDFANPEGEALVGQAKLERERTLGAVKTKLAEWLKRNPDAKPAEIDAKVGDIIGGQGRARKVQDMMPKKASASTGPKGASDETAAVPVGKNLSEVVKQFEAGGAPGGFHSEAYWDYGQWSIGYGTKAKEGETIDKAEAEKRLSTELASARADVEAEAKRVGMTLKPHEVDALTSFQFNTGRISTLLAGGERTKSQVADMMLEYRKADGKTLRGLENRRKAERALFLNGYPS